jgi:N-methylhydantoinase A/oxoprolinase/acetone carboxylase beta subunit
MKVRLSANIGHTFTDVVLSDWDRITCSEKVLKTCRDFSEGTMNDIERVLQIADLTIGTVNAVFQNTILIASVLIESFYGH